VTTYDLSREDIEALPQGSNTPIDKVLLQAPGVTQDSAASDNLHVRNDHANLQYRINASSFPTVFRALANSLKRAYADHRRAPGAVRLSQHWDCRHYNAERRAGPGRNGFYGCGHDAFTPNNRIRRIRRPHRVLLQGRGFFSNLGLENPTASYNAIHDQTQQGRAFAYASTLLDDSTRPSTISGVFIQNFQIPNNPG
jgi:hypothetical protein